MEQTWETARIVATHLGKAGGETGLGVELDCLPSMVVGLRGAENMSTAQIQRQIAGEVEVVRWTGGEKKGQIASLKFAGGTVLVVDSI